MGIKSFSKIFTYSKKIKLAQLKNCTLVIDGFIQAYQSALGMSNVRGLTDASGNPTIHINVILSRVIKFKLMGITQLWIFDYDANEDTSAEFHNPAKMIELEKRKKRKEVAQKKIKELNKKKKALEEKNNKNDDLFSDSDNDDIVDTNSETKESIDSKILKQEKASFSMNRSIINDIKFILNCFDIPWANAIKGTEAEQICADLTSDEDNAIADYAYTTDTDCIAYGCTSLIRPDYRKKEFHLYETDKILSDNEITMDELLDICVIMGTDFCNKTPGIGPKTVLRKFRTTELTDEQKNAKKLFKKHSDLTKLKWQADPLDGPEPFDDSIKINALLNWLVDDKGFNRDRVKKQMIKVVDADIFQLTA
jgi:flap endonuclease-1